MRPVPFAALALLLLAPTAAAQTAVWGGPGVALSTAGIGLQLELSRHASSRLTKLRLGVSAAGFMAAEAQEVDAVLEGALLFGRGRPVGMNWGSVAVGPAVVGVERSTGSATTLGVGAEAQLLSHRVPHLGLTLLANLNPRHSFAGLALSLVVGRMPWPAASWPRPGRPP